MFEIRKSRIGNGNLNIRLFKPEGEKFLFDVVNDAKLSIGGYIIIDDYGLETCDGFGSDDDADNDDNGDGPALGPVMLTYFNRIIPNGGIKIDWHHVAAKTTAYNFCMFNNIKFEAIKEVYADCIASEISANIITRLPPCNIESFIDDVSGTTIDILKGCDYIATSESYLKRLKSKFNLTGIDVIEISTMLNPDSFSPLAVAGKYPLNIFTPPIFCPYILFSATPPTNLNYIKLVSRAGWFEYSTELKSKNIL